MWAQLQLFTIPIILGIISILTGFIMFKFPPKRINMLYGYRTKKSISTQETWDYSQKYAANIMMKLGIIVVLLSVVVSLFSIPQKVIPFIIITGIAIGVLSLISVIFITEHQLKKKFKKQ